MFHSSYCKQRLGTSEKCIHGRSSVPWQLAALGNFLSVPASTV